MATGKDIGVCAEGGHVGEILCSSAQHWLTEDCLRDPTQSLCARLAKKYIAACRNCNEYICPGRLVGLGDECWNRLLPTERANLSQVVTCVFEYLDPDVEIIEMEILRLLICATIVAVVATIALTSLYCRKISQNSRAKYELERSQIYHDSTSNENVCSPSSGDPHPTDNEDSNSGDNFIGNEDAHSVIGDGIPLSACNETYLSSNSGIHHSHSAGNGNSHSDGNGKPHSAADGKDAHSGNEKGNPNSLNKGDNSKKSNKKVQTAVVYPEVKEAVLPDITSNFVARFNVQSRAGTLVPHSFYKLANVPDDTLVLVPCLVGPPTRLGRDVRRVLREHGIVESSAPSSNRVLLILHHRQPEALPVTPTLSILSRSQRHLASAFKEVIDVVFRETEVYDCHHNQQAFKALNKIVRTL